MSNNDPQKKRKGFHPALVISTIAVIIFVLWFCPYALMRARITQTEETAAALLLKNEFTTLKNAQSKDGYIEVAPDKKFTDYRFFRSEKNPAALYAIPEYYGKTSRTTFYITDNSLYKKDITDVKISEFKFPQPDTTWTK